MLDSIEQTILSTLQIIFDQFGWHGVFVLMIFENATGITPSEIILACAGWMLIERHALHPSFILLAGLYAGFGSAIGSSITYWIARLGGRPLVNKFAAFFRIKLGYIEQIETQCKKWGMGIVFAGRLIPGVRTLISIPAGLVQIPFPKFFLASFTAAVLWCTILIGAGYLLGQEWQLISRFLKTNLPFIFAAGFLFGISYLVYHYRASISIPGWMRLTRKEQD